MSDDESESDDHQELENEVERIAFGKESHQNLREIDQLSEDEAIEAVNNADVSEAPRESVGKFSKLKQDEKFKELMAAVQADLESQA